MKFVVGKNGRNSVKNLPRPRFVHHETHMEGPRRELGTPAVGGERITACATRPPSFTEINPNLKERFIVTDTASVELFFNIFTSGIETFVIPWDQLVYPCVVEVCRLGLEPLCDTHIHLSVILRTMTAQAFIEV